MTESAARMLTHSGDDASLIAIVDDHPIMRDAVEEIVRATHPDRTILGFGSLPALVESGTNPGLLLLDLALPGSAGLESLVNARALFPEAAIVVFSAEETRATILACLEAGASGYIVKAASRALLIAALGVVLSGGVFVPSQSLPARGSALNGAARQAGGENAAPGVVTVGDRRIELTQRQQEVLALLIRGLSNKLICRRLALAENTVKTHIRAIFDALQVNSRVQAVIRAGELGLRLNVHRD